MVEFTVYELKLLVQLQCYGDVLIELLLTSSCMLLECRIIFTVLNYILVKLNCLLLVLVHQGVQIIQLWVFYRGYLGPVFCVSDGW